MHHLRLALTLGALALPLVYPSQARACGGTFCDNGPVPMPVDQRGEDILFVQDGPEIEVHVRIEYEGDAERFAWLVPIQAVPEISVGSELLFTALANGTAPQWTSARYSDCPDEAPPTTTTGAPGMGFVPDDDIGSGHGPELVFADHVGAFEVVVLQGGTAAEVIEFLDQNGYAQDPEAAPILQEYLDENFLFAAVKLTAGGSTNSIHPLVFRFPGDEPCVPIRLTRIAAKPDMGIRAYFLGQERWAPLNYQHVVLNPLAFAWSDLDGQTLPDYTELLTLAVDEAGGHAFATDYAGSSTWIKTGRLYNPDWNEAAFIGIHAAEAIDLIRAQSLDTHPLTLSLLIEFIPPPDGVDPQAFYNLIASCNYASADVDAGVCGDSFFDVDAWDSAGFAAALAERIIEPGLHAVNLLETWPYLTRLHTTISPHEMTVDPMFQPAPQLGHVANRLLTLSVDLCNGAGERYSVPWSDTSLQVCVESPGLWPTELQAHPALRIEQIPLMGPPQVLEDFREAVLATHAAYQLDNECGAAGANLNDDASKAGCACRSDAPGSWSSAALGLLGLASLLNGWRRRQRPHF